MNTESGIPVTGLYADEAPSGYIEPPTSTQFHSGVEPEMTLPAAWWNYFVNLFTNTNIKTKEDITAILAELNNALTAMGITPDPEASNQLATLFQNDVLPVTFANANMNANPYTTSSLVPKHRGNIAINTTTRTTWIATGTAAAAASWSRLWSPENDGSGSGLDADTVDGSHYNATDILTKLKTVDGAGSGLDADLLDGIDSSSIIYGSNAYGSTILPGNSSLNSITKSGFYSGNGLTDAPVSVGNSLIIHTAYGISEGAAVQIWMNNTTPGLLYFRTKTFGEWTPWRKIWNEANDGTGSGLDSDLIRGTTPGARGLQYLAAAAVSNIAALILADLKTVDGPGSGLDADTVDGSHYNATDILTKLKTVAGSGSGLDADKVRGTTPGTRGLQYLAAAAVSNIAALILADLKTVDGHGSGLDADLLDGQDGSYYAPKASPAFTGNPTAPTQAAGNNSTRLATTAFVANAAASVTGIQVRTSDPSSPSDGTIWLRSNV